MTIPSPRASQPASTVNDTIADFIRNAGEGGRPASAVWASLKGAVDADLAEFYAAMQRVPELKRALGEGEQVSTLAASQMRHWETLFADALPEDFAARARAVGDTHGDIALPSGWYTAAYGWLLIRLLPRLTAKHRFNRRALNAALTTLVSRVFYDMILANAAFEARSMAEATSTLASENDLKNLRNLAGTVGDVNNVAFDLAHLSRNTRNLTSGAQTIASAAAELVASVEDIARNSEGAAADAAETNRNVLGGRAAVEQVNGAIANIAAAVEETARSVDELSVASEQIGQILGVIESIAGQTNLLALNATIEAARAGAAGRGFAVVASEVKSLATQTSTSTEDITRRIASLREGMTIILSTMQRSKTAVVEGQSAITQAAETMGVVADQVGTVTVRMQGISEILHQQQAATTEIAASINKVAAIAEDNNGLLGSISSLLHDGNGRFAENAKSWFAANSNRSLVEMAKIDHVLFKKRIVDVLMGRETWGSAHVPDHHNCRLGKWFDSITLPEIKALPAYARLVEPHKRVHAAGIRALSAHEAGNMDDALAALREMNLASAEVLAVLDDMAAALNREFRHLDRPRDTKAVLAAAPAGEAHCCNGH